MLTYRSVGAEDVPIICTFPQSARELFLLFPKATYPLTPDQLNAAIAARMDSTVILRRALVAGFANIYECETGERCWIGNVIVDPRERGTGVGKYLIEIMIQIAREKHRVREVRISCFNENIVGLLLYEKLGFEPYAVEERLDLEGERVAMIHMRMIRPAGRG